MKLKLVKIVDEARDTKSFYFKPEKKINYLPGQYYYFTLPKLSQKDSRGSTRMFTLSLSPTEGDLIRFTTRMRESSGYKHTLEEFTIGTEISGDGPEGSYIFDEKEKGDHVFLAGGIGITPFRSMIKYALDKKMETNLHLIYSNSIPEEITFRAELEKWSKSSKNFKLDMTITKPSRSRQKWNSLTGRIDEEMFKSLIPKPQIPNTTFWIVGPPAFVEGMIVLMKKIDIPSSRVRSEKFYGY